MTFPTLLTFSRPRQLFKTIIEKGISILNEVRPFPMTLSNSRSSVLEQSWARTGKELGRKLTIPTGTPFSLFDVLFLLLTKQFSTDTYCFHETSTESVSTFFLFALVFGVSRSPFSLDTFCRFVPVFATVSFSFEDVEAGTFTIPISLASYLIV